jgi:hypothetical protein
MMEKPLLVGRFLRIILGISALVYLFFCPWGLFWQVVLGFLGVSLVIGGIIAYPGCEIWALPSLLFRKRLHCF